MEIAEVFTDPLEEEEITHALEDEWGDFLSDEYQEVTEDSDTS